MHYAGVLPEDAPDPRLEQDKKLTQMPVPVMGLVSQPSLEDNNLVSIASDNGPSGMTEMSVSINYSLWRNPSDRADPVNLADLSDDVRRSLDEVPPWPRPSWLLERVELMRYPMLWETVRTTWHRDASELSTPRHVLVEHANYVLMNRFRAELGLGDVHTDRFAQRLTERAVNDRASVIVNGAKLPALEIDTDPFVYAVGAELDSGGVLTAVIPRDALAHVRVKFVERGVPGIYGSQLP